MALPDKFPAVTCIGVIGKQDNPLHVALFPTADGKDRDSTHFQFLLHTSLDIFEIRLGSGARVMEHDLGLLQAIDQSLAMYGWLTSTGIKFVIMVDFYGRNFIEGDPRCRNNGSVVGIRDADLKPAFHALHAFWARLLRNPFFVPDEHTPELDSSETPMEIRSPTFINAVRRIGEDWYPGILSM